MAVIERQSKAFLNRREAAELLAIKTQTLASWAHSQRGPAFIKVGRRLILLNNVLVWLTVVLAALTIVLVWDAFHPSREPAQRSSVTAQK